MSHELCITGTIFFKIFLDDYLHWLLIVTTSTSQGLLSHSVVGKNSNKNNRFRTYVYVVNFKMVLVNCILITMLYLGLWLLVQTSSEVAMQVAAASGVASSQPLLSSINMAADASWEFNVDLDGWAKSTIEEMEADIYQTGGEMRIQINGNHPHFDSPVMSLSTGSRETMVLKYRYIGQSTQGMVQVFGGPLSANISNYSWNTSTSYSVYFYILNDGNWHVAYIPLETSHVITSLRLWPAIHRPADDVRTESPAPNAGNSFHIDWIRILRGPVIKRVTGCFGEMYSDEMTFNDKVAKVTQSKVPINRFLNYSRTVWDRRNTSMTYGRTYNCKREGGELITIEGLNFGAADSGAHTSVEIDGIECSHVTHDRTTPEELLTCVTPRMLTNSNPETRYSLITIRHGRLHGLFYEAPFFRYAINPPIPSGVFVSNVASR